jgi:hypothetical protein
VIVSSFLPLVSSRVWIRERTKAMKMYISPIEEHFIIGEVSELREFVFENAVYIYP